MPSAYFPIFVLVILATGLGGIILLISRFLGPHREQTRRMSPYESGIVAQVSAHMRFPVKFYLVAMLFIVFDIEAVFFYPWAVTFRQLRLFGFVEMLVFIAILLVGYFYLVKKGALEWE